MYQAILNYMKVFQSEPVKEEVKEPVVPPVVETPVPLKEEKVDEAKCMQCKEELNSENKSSTPGTCKLCASAEPTDEAKVTELKYRIEKSKGGYKVYQEHGGSENFLKSYPTEEEAKKSIARHRREFNKPDTGSVYDSKVDEMKVAELEEALVSSCSFDKQTQTIIWRNKAYELPDLIWDWMADTDHDDWDFFEILSMKALAPIANGDYMLTIKRSGDDRDGNPIKELAKRRLSFFLDYYLMDTRTPGKAVPSDVLRRAKTVRFTPEYSASEEAKVDEMKLGFCKQCKAQVNVDLLKKDVCPKCAKEDKEETKEAVVEEDSSNLKDGIDALQKALAKFVRDNMYVQNVSLGEFGITPDSALKTKKIYSFGAAKSYESREGGKKYKILSPEELDQLIADVKAECEQVQTSYPKLKTSVTKQKSSDSEWSTIVVTLKSNASEAVVEEERLTQSYVSDAILRAIKELSFVEGLSSTGAENRTFLLNIVKQLKTILPEEDLSRFEAKVEEGTFHRCTKCANLYPVTDTDKAEQMAKCPKCNVVDVLNGPHKDEYFPESKVNEALLGDVGIKNFEGSTITNIQQEQTLSSSGHTIDSLRVTTDKGTFSVWGRQVYASSSLGESKVEEGKASSDIAMDVVTKNGDHIKANVWFKYWNNDGVIEGVEVYGMDDGKKDLSLADFDSKEITRIENEIKQQVSEGKVNEANRQSDWAWAAELDYDKNLFWPVFEGYASGDFNEVADYNYSTLASAIRSGEEFISNKNWNSFIARLKQVYGIKESVAEAKSWEGFKISHLGEGIDKINNSDEVARFYDIYFNDKFSGFLKRFSDDISGSIDYGYHYIMIPFYAREDALKAKASLDKANWKTRVSKDPSSDDYMLYAHLSSSQINQVIDKYKYNVKESKINEEENVTQEMPKDIPVEDKPADEPLLKPDEIGGGDMGDKPEKPEDEEVVTKEEKKKVVLTSKGEQFFYIDDDGTNIVITDALGKEVAKGELANAKDFIKDFLQKEGVDNLNYSAFEKYVMPEEKEVEKLPPSDATGLPPLEPQGDSNNVSTAAATPVKQESKEVVEHKFLIQKRDDGQFDLVNAAGETKHTAKTKEEALAWRERETAKESIEIVDEAAVKLPNGWSYIAKKMQLYPGGSGPKKSFYVITILDAKGKQVNELHLPVDSTVTSDIYNKVLAFIKKNPEPVQYEEDQSSGILIQAKNIKVGDIILYQGVGSKVVAVDQGRWDEGVVVLTLDTNGSEEQVEFDGKDKLEIKRRQTKESIEIVEGETYKFPTEEQAQKYVDELEKTNLFWGKITPVGGEWIVRVVKKGPQKESKEGGRVRIAGVFDMLTEDIQDTKEDVSIDKIDRDQAKVNKKEAELAAAGYVRYKDSTSSYTYRWEKKGSPTWRVNYRTGDVGNAIIWKDK